MGHVQGWGSTKEVMRVCLVWGDKKGKWERIGQVWGAVSSWAQLQGGERVGSWQEKG